MSQWQHFVMVGVAVLLVVVIYYRIRSRNRAMKRQTFPFDLNSIPKEVSSDPDEALSQVVWLEPDENQFNMRVLDCRAFCIAMLREFPDFSYAGLLQKFQENRKSSGEEHCRKEPPNRLCIEAGLSYPHDRKPLNDGAVFSAANIDDKWDIFLHDGHLYFAHSWAGELHFRATIQFAGDELVVTGINANSNVTGGDAEVAIRMVDFLIKSHLYNFECPHPVPKSMEIADERTIAIWSYKCLGRRGHFASFEDTTSVRIAR